MKTVAIIQARLTSTRFPRKVLAKIGDKTMLQHVIDNVNRARGINKVIVATPHHINFKNAEEYIWIIDENDVLARYYWCAREYQADKIIRITSDCPLLKATYINYAIECFNWFQFPYIKFALRDGFDVEIFTYHLLQEVYENAKDPYDREHVTPYMQRVTKLSVDTPEDLEKVKQWINGKELRK